MAFESRIVERFSGRHELELVVPAPSVATQPEIKEAANNKEKPSVGVATERLRYMHITGNRDDLRG
jgi:hypothetical protein